LLSKVEAIAFATLSPSALTLADYAYYSSNLILVSSDLA